VCSSDLPILTQFCQKHSNLHIHYDVNSSIKDLIADQLDIVIRLGNLPDSSLKSRKIGQFQIILVASPVFLEKYPVDQLDDLLKVPWITQSQWQNHHFTLTNHITQQGFHFVPPQGKHQTNAGGLTHLMAADGLGLTICPLWLVEDDLNQGKLIRVLPDYSLPMQDIHALYLHQKHLPNKTRLFIDYLKQHYFNS
jgi:DNA-binding transcriptional LysR family regulator